MDEFFRLPEWKQIQRAQQIVGESRNSQGWINALIANQIPTAARETFFSGLLELPLDASMPAYGEIADNPRHPDCESAREIIRTHFEAPPSGRHWRSWVVAQLAVQTIPFD